MTWQSTSIVPGSTEPATDVTKLINDLGVLRSVIGGGTDPDVPKAWDEPGTSLPKAGGVMTGGLRLARGAMGVGVNLDVAAANLFTKTITGATTFTVSNVPAAGTLACFLLDLTNGGSATITWWAGIKWPGGAAPTLTASGRDTLGFFTHDGGTTWTGVLVARDAK